MELKIFSSPNNQSSLSFNSDFYNRPFDGLFQMSVVLSLNRDFTYSSHSRIVLFLNRSLQSSQSSQSFLFLTLLLRLLAPVGEVCVHYVLHQPVLNIVDEITVKRNGCCLQLCQEVCVLVDMVLRIFIKVWNL